jgi:hypothetical protein
MVEETIVPGEIDCCETFKVERILIFPVFGSNNSLVQRTTALHTIKTDCHDIAEILLKVALNTINKQT